MSPRSVARRLFKVEAENLLPLFDVLARHSLLTSNGADQNGRAKIERRDFQEPDGIELIHAGKAVETGESERKSGLVQLTEVVAEPRGEWEEKKMGTKAEWDGGPVGGSESEAKAQKKRMYSPAGFEGSGRFSQSACAR